MTDKEQIMINGVDVSGCVSFDKCNGKNLCCYDDTREDKIPFANFCVENKDCYYKQLTLKTQECEELKRKVELMMDCADCKVDKYKQALDEIEKELKEDIYCENQECGCDDFEECLKCTKEHILDIINKADFGKSERSETRPGESCVEPVEPPIIQEAKGEGNDK